MTNFWSYKKGGKTITEGKFFGASVLHVRPEGKWKGTGVYDGDTLYNVTIEIPDSNDDDVIDSRDWIDVDGEKVPVPEAWHTENKNRKGATFSPGESGNVYMQGAGIRLAGYDAWEIKDAKGPEARDALIKLFQQGWTSDGGKRFIFRVRGVGKPYKHTNAPRSKQNPYIEDNANWGRIVTDVFIVVNGKEERVAEVTFKNPAQDLIDTGHGESYRRWQ